MTETCENCKYWIINTCRKNPPMSNYGIGEWPMTKNDDWCGEWIDKPIKFKEVGDEVI